jgi:hypothetical protein
MRLASQMEGGYGANEADAGENVDKLPIHSWVARGTEHLAELAQ